MENENKILTLANLTGKIALQSGAETYRVEDIISRICKHYGLNAHVLYLLLALLPLLEIIKVRFSALLKEFNQELQI